MHKNEAKIYEALLSLGPANVSEIASAGKVNRRNVYDSLRGLLEKNIVFRISDTRENKYQAAEPKTLLQMLFEQKKMVSSVLPELKQTYSLHMPDEQAFIARGVEGIKNFWRYIASQTGPVLFVAGKGAWHDSKINEERKIYFKSCKEKNITIQGIFDYEMLKTGKDIYSEYQVDQLRFFPEGFSTKSTMDICGNRVLMFTMPKGKSIENSMIFNIISPALADSFRIWFKYLWQLSKPLKIENGQGISKKT
ncbi:helix-turn-helix domain-containing protein [Patescibacteria group bacterium]|nr:helix-turn-helix domain-containing protein [Patescibacteria group bacterium]MBU0963819.1 helix-turn-helix domain-containing protein [Patescibacteria group bacterium]